MDCQRSRRCRTSAEQMDCQRIRRCRPGSSGDWLWTVQAHYIENFPSFLSRQENGFRGGCKCAVAKRHAGEGRQGLWGVETLAQRGWTCGSTDIKSAFLQAPKRSAHRVTLVKPPQLVTQLGIVPPGTMWAAEGAFQDVAAIRIYASGCGS